MTLHFSQMRLTLGLTFIVLFLCVAVLVPDAVFSRERSELRDLPGRYLQHTFPIDTPDCSRVPV